PCRGAVPRVVAGLGPRLRPGDLEVGVVPGGLGEVADRVRQRQGREPAVRVVLAADPPPLVPPARQLLLKPLLDHVIGQNRKLLLLLRFLRHDASHISCLPARRRQPMTTPPPTMMVSPVMNDACGEARKSTADATSSGVPQRARGVAPTTERLVASS